MTDTDRTIHAILVDDSVIVRYDKAGKWYREWPLARMIPAERITVGKAARLAVTTNTRGGTVNLHLPGGRTFDRLYFHFNREMEHA